MTPLIQPIDQGVIQSLKVHYRRRLLEQLLCSDNLAAKSAPDFYKMVDLRDCCYLVAERWEAIKQSTLRNAWNKILTHRRKVESSADNDTVEDEIARTLRHFPPYSESDEADVHRLDLRLFWMNDEEIVDFVSKKSAGNEEEQQAAEDEEERTMVTAHSEAFAHLDAALLWFEEQEECDGRRLLCLKSIRDLAASKRQNLLKQTLITD
uniref:DDE-1 domain-containing protein n=1 Tax=Trichuris muris TaxID=70415 RepID=A0A5S6QLG0_TRIMR